MFTYSKIIEPILDCPEIFSAKYLRPLLFKFSLKDIFRTKTESRHILCQNMTWMVSITVSIMVPVNLINWDSIDYIAFITTVFSIPRMDHWAFNYFSVQSSKVFSIPPRKHSQTCKSKSLLPDLISIFITYFYVAMIKTSWQRQLEFTVFEPPYCFNHFLPSIVHKGTLGKKFFFCRQLINITAKAWYWHHEAAGHIAFVLRIHPERDGSWCLAPLFLIVLLRILFNRIVILALFPLQLT